MKDRSPFVSAERGYIDDVIMPHSTRKRIARAGDVADEAGEDAGAEAR
jgi:acetyl-CoA carboxylase carboxyltransferase component